MKNGQTPEASTDAPEETGARAEPEAPATAVDIIADARAARIDEVVEQWFVRAIHNSPASQHTPIFNHVRQAVDELKRTLSREL